MATDVERLMIRLEASAAKFEKEMQKARGVADRQTKAIEERFERLNPAVSRSMASLGAALAGALSVNEFRKASDAYIKTINSLKVAGLSGQQLSGVFDQLFASAQRNAVPVQGLAELYGRLSQAQTTLKASSGDLLGLTEIVAQSLRVSGKSAQESSGALLQLGQALSGGKVQAEEYNSLLDGMYPLLQAAAAGIKEAGGDVATLTKLVKDGKVSSEAFFRGIQAGAPLLKEQLADAALTTEQAMTRLNNEFIKAVGEFDKAVGVSAAVASGMDSIAGSIGGVGKAAAEATLAVGRLLQALQQGTRDIANFLSSGAQATAQQNRTILETRLRDPGLTPQQRAGYQAQLDAMNNGGDRRGGNFPLADQRQAYLDAGAATGDFGNVDTFYPQYRDRSALTFPRQGRLAGQVKPISLKDYKVPGEDDKKGPGGADKQSEYEREIAQLQKKTELLKAEADAIGLGTIAVEKSKAIRELELAAKKSGVELTPQIKAAIEQEAEAYAAAKKAVQEKNEALEQSKKLQEFIGSSMSSFFSDIISGGKNASDALMNLTKRLADAALQAALLGQGPLASLFGTASSSAGGVGGLVGALFGGFRASGGPVSPGQAYVVGEKRPELFVPRTPGVILPKVPQGNGGTSQINVSLSPELVGQVLKAARNEAIRITQAGIAQNNQRLPGMLEETNAR